MEDTFLRHGTTVNKNVGQGVGTSGVGTSRVGQLYIEDLVRYTDPTISRDHNGNAEGSEHHVMPHPCTTYAMGLIQSFAVMGYSNM